uniref:WD repeat-containing protein 17 n=1 Tax=Anthurium amnicola TaxID=1678845 RepID=A0A1D1XW16_9ARAE
MAFSGDNGSMEQQSVASRPGLELTAEPDVVVPSMNALEILRESVRILRRDGTTFAAILLLLVCPVSAALLSDVLVSRTLVGGLAHRFLLVAGSSGLPLTHLVRQLCHHLAGTLLSAASCFPLLLTFLLLARACIAYSVACCYARKKVLASEFLALVRKIWGRLLSTYLWVCGAILSCLGIFLLLLFVVCNAFSLIGYPPELIVYPAFLAVLAFSVTYAHTIIVCNLASVISVLEEWSGLQALLRSIYLVRGQTRAGLLIFLGSTIGMAFVEGLFEHRVKTLSYGDGSSRIWEGPLLVMMYSFVVLVDSMMSSVFYFTCRSSNMEELNEIGDSVNEIGE